MKKKKNFGIKKGDKKMELFELMAVTDKGFETLAHRLKEKEEIKRTEAWEKLKEALKENLEYDTIVVHKEYPEDTEICAVDFQDLSFNGEGVICVYD